ncbi:MAG: hypothetical protein EXR11_10190 [Rhodospirillaceae bacterium]|nr:hypothetical protein [Rhodospirillaceae bacterium]
MTWSRRNTLISASATAMALHTPVMAEDKKKNEMPLLGGKLMFMVERSYATDKDIAALRTPQEPAHQQHLLKFGQTVVASAIIEPDGKRGGSVSISDINTRADIERYVYDDPFTKAGIYGSIKITPVDPYKVDGTYNRAPAWFSPELQRRQQAAGYNVPVLPTSDVGAKTMFLVRRLYATDRDVEAIRKTFDPAHNAHLLKYSKTVVSAAILDDANNRIGGISISDTDDRATIERYVNDDPFTINGMFSTVQIERVDMYKLDGSYNRAPEWFAGEMKRRQEAKKPA